MATSNTNTDNIMNNLNEPPVFYPILGLIVVLVFIIIYYLFSNKPPTDKSNFSQEQFVTGVWVTLGSSLLIIGIAIAMLPFFKTFRQFLYQIRSSFYSVLYTIALIVFFANVPDDILTKYSSIIVPASLFFAGYFLFKGVTTDYLSSFNVNYERIKSIIVFVCLVTLMITFYSADPGGYIKSNFGYSWVLTMILAIFSLLYMIVLLTLQEKDQSSPENAPQGLFNIFTKFSVYGSISFVLFLILVTIGISTFPGGFTNNKVVSASVIIMLLLVVLLWSMLLIVNIFTNASADKLSSVNYMNISKRVLLMLLGLTTSGLLIAWIAINIQNFTGVSSVSSLMLNTLVIVIVLALAYKTMNVELPAKNSNKNAFFRLIINSIFYIPCLFTGLLDFAVNIAKGDYKSTSDPAHIGTSLLIIATITAITLAYKGIRILFTKINQQGGKLLVNNPVYTNDLHSLATHQQLTGGDNFNYQYGISCWIYVDSAPPNANPSYKKYTSLLNYGGKPNILYKANTNTLLVSVTNAHPLPEQPDDSQDDTDNHVEPRPIIENVTIDGVSHRVIYKRENFPLQKWNNLLINYNGGTLDVFLNGELVKSSIEVVPYMTLDTLSIGEKGGINGGICNVVYFNKPLTRSNIYYLYNTVKNITPPVTFNNDETIISLGQ